MGLTLCFIAVAASFWMLGFLRGHVRGWNDSTDLHDRAVNQCFPSGENRERYYYALKTTCHRDDCEYNQKVANFRSSIGL